MFLKAGVLVFYGLLGLAFAGQWLPLDPVPAPQEKRPAIPRPGVPGDWEGIRAYPSSLRRWHDENFGFRNALLLARNWTKVRVLHTSPNPNVLLGADSRLFLFRSVFPDGFEEKPPWSRADLLQFASHLESRADEFRKRHVAYAFLVCPETAVFHQASLPPWARHPLDQRRTQLTAFLRSRGRVFMPDLGPLLEETMRSGEAYLLHDSHWNEEGSFAGYASLLRALQFQASACRLPVQPFVPLGRQDFRITQAGIQGGDLADLVGLGAVLKEIQPHFDPLAQPRLEVKLPVYEDFILANPRSISNLHLTVFKDSYFEGPARFVGLHFHQMSCRNGWDVDPTVIASDASQALVQELAGRYLDEYFRVMVQPWPLQGDEAPSLEGHDIRRDFKLLQAGTCAGSFDGGRVYEGSQWNGTRLIEFSGTAGPLDSRIAVECILLTDGTGKVLGAGKLESGASKNSTQWRAWIPERKLTTGQIEAYALLAGRGVCLLGVLKKE